MDAYKKIVGRTALGVCLMLPVGIAVAPATFAQGASDLADACRQLDEAGVLDEPGLNLTRGECVNILKGPDSASAAAGLCGFDFVLSFFGTANKGQCIKVVKTLS